jgi:hypothetical protein
VFLREVGCVDSGLQKGASLGQRLPLEVLQQLVIYRKNMKSLVVSGGENRVTTRAARTSAHRPRGACIEIASRQRYTDTHLDRHCDGGSKRYREMCRDVHKA